MTTLDQKQIDFVNGIKAILLRAVADDVIGSFSICRDLLFVKDNNQLIDFWQVVIHADGCIGGVGETPAELIKELGSKLIELYQKAGKTYNLITHHDNQIIFERLTEDWQDEPRTLIENVLSQPTVQESII